MFNYKKYFLIFILMFLIQGCSSLSNPNGHETYYLFNEQKHTKLPTYIRDYYKKILPILAKNLIFPKEAIKLNQEGTVITSFEINTQKEISNLKIAQSCGFPILDKEALKTIKISSKEFPSPIQDLKIIVPVKFILY